MQTGGSNTNGGFFYNRDPGTSVDYSQQTSAQLSLADITTDGAGTGVGSVTGGFTAAMVGNGIYLTGGGASAGWYEITAYTDTNTVTIDRSAGLNLTGVTGNVGGCVALPTDTLLQAFTNAAGAPYKGNTLYTKAGTYTLTGAITVTPPPYNVDWIGYKTTRGDAPTGTDRPLMTCGANEFQVGAGWWLVHLRGTMTHADGLHGFDWGTLENLKWENTSGTATRNAIEAPQDSRIIDCELVSTNGRPAELMAIEIHFVRCYFHDSSLNVSPCSADTIFVECIFDTIQGVNASQSNCMFTNCTFYNCSSYGIYYSSISIITIYNCLFESCPVGIQFASASTRTRVYIDYNNYHGNTADVTNVTKGSNATTHDPDFEDAAGGDFRLKTGSSCLTAGKPITLGVGASVTTHQGAVPGTGGAGGAVGSLFNGVIA